jgi:autotransporter-associated beta strand protein
MNLLGLLVAAMLGLVVVTPAQATEYTWTQTGTPGPYDFDAAGNWSGLTYTAPTNADTISLTADITGAQQIALTGTTPITMNVLNIGAATTGYAYTLSTGTGAPLTFDGANAQLNEVSTSAGDTIATAISLVAGAAPTTISGIIGSGGTVSGGLTKDGTGTLTLTVANLYTGATTISDGTLSISGSINNSTTVNVNGGLLSTTGADKLANTAVVTVAGGTLTVGGDDTVGSLIMSSGTIGGSSTLTAATYGFSGGAVDAMLGAGAITVDTGTTTLGSAGRLTGTPSLTINSGQLTLGGAESVGAYIQAGGTLAGAYTLTGTSYSLTNTGTISANLGGSGITLTKTGAGTATLTGANTYTGATAINEGTLSINDVDTSTNPQPLGENAAVTLGVAATSSGTLVYTGGADTLDKNIDVLGNGSDTIENSGSGLLTLSGTLTKNGTTLTLKGGANGITVSGVIAGTSANSDLIINGGITTLTNANTYTGATSINNGTLSINDVDTSTNPQPLGENAAVTLGVAATSSGRLLYTGVAGTLDKNITALGNGGDTIQNSGSGLLTLSGTLTKNGTTLTLKGGTNGITVSGVIAGASANSDLVIDGGITTLTNANTYNGPTFIINAGTLNADVTDALPTLNGRTAVSIDATGSGSSTLALGASQSAASLTGAASSTVNLSAIGGNTLTVGTTAGSTTFAGTISGTGGSLTKDGASTLVLSGANTYNGATAINNGTLSINAVATGVNPQPLGENAAVTLGVAATSSGRLLYTGGAGELDKNIDVLGNGSDTIENSGSGLLTLSGTLTKNSTTLTLKGGANGITVSGVIAGASANSDLIINGGITTLTNANTYTGATSINNGTLSINDVDTGVNPQPLGENADVTLGVAATSSGTLLYTGGADTLDKNITALGNGGDTIQNTGGLLTLSGTLTKNGTTLTLKGGANGITVSGVIAGASANSDLIIDGGITTLTSANTYNGATVIINVGTLNANVVDALPTAIARSAVSMDQTGSGSSTLALGASQSVASLTGAASSGVNLNANTLTVGTTAGSTTFAGGISGTGGSLTKDGASTQVLSGPNSYTGTTSINNGVLQADHATALGNGGDVTFGGGTLQFGSVLNNQTVAWGARIKNSTAGAIKLDTNGQAVTLSGIIPSSNTQGLTKSGAGTLTLSGANAYTGGTKILAGTVTATTSASALGTGLVTLGDTTGSSAASLLVGTTALTYANPIVLATNGSVGTLTIGTTGSGISTTFSGGVTGTNNFTINESSGTGGAGTITFSTLPINNAGTVTNIGTGTGTTTISGGVGSSVTAITENSTTSALTIGTTALAMNSGGTTLTNSNASGGALFTVSGGVIDKGNLILNNNSAIANGITLSTTSVNNIGTITNQGSNAGTGNTLISTVIGPNVTGVTQNSTTSGLTLSGVNTYAGGTNILAGTVTATTSASALGTNLVTLGNTTGSSAASLLVGTSGLTFANPIVLATNGSVGTLTIGNTGSGISTTFSGGVSGTNNFTINENATTGTITFSISPINNAGTVTNIGAGSGTTTISGGVGSNVTTITENSTTSALTIGTLPLAVNSGGTTLTNSNAGGAALFTVSGGVIGTGNLILNNNSAIANGITLSTTSVNNAGTITNSGTSTGNTLISAVIGANVTGVTQNSGTSGLTLSGANLYSGNTQVSSGRLTIGNNLALQNSALDTSGAGLITITGFTTPTFGGLVNSGTARDLATVIDTGYAAVTALTLNPGSGVSNTYSGAIANGAAGMTLTLSGPGTQVLTGANGYTGLTTISGGGTLQVGNGTSGSLNAATGLTFSGRGGTFGVQAAAAGSQTLGALTFSAGEDVVNSTFNATSATLTFASLAARTAGATANFTTTGGTDGTPGTPGTNVINFTASPGTGYINQGTFFNGSNYAYYDTVGAPNFVRGIVYGTDADSESIASSTGSFTAGKLYEQITGDDGEINNQGTQTITTLNINNARPLALAGGATLQLNGILKSGNAAGGIISGGTGLQAVSAGGELVVRTNGASDTLTVNTPILDNTNSLLTKSGAGTLILSAANTYAGKTTINNGTLQANNATALGTTGDVTFGGGTLQFGSALNNQTVAWGGRIKNSAAPVKLDTNSQAVTFSGAIPSSNTAGLTKSGAGTLTVVTPQSYVGPTVISGGTLQLASASGSLGAGLKGGWTFNASNANDSSGNGWNGTGVNAPTYVTDTHTGSGYSLNLASASSQLVYVDTGGSGNQKVFDGGSAMTISFWAKGTLTAGWNPYISKYGEGSAGWQARRNNSNNYCWTLRGGGGGDMGGAAIDYANWHMVTMTYDANGGANNKNIYIDGVLSTTGTTTGNIAASAAMLAFGARATGDAYSTTAWGNYFNGKMDDIYFYNRALTAAEITALQTANNASTTITAYGSLPAATALSIASGSALDLNGGSQQVASLSDYSGGGGTVQNTYTGVASTLTLAPTGGSASFSGVIAGGGGLGTLNLVLNGTGTQVLSGSNTYTGTTTVTSGTLRIGAASALPSATAVTLANAAAAVLDLSGNSQTIGSLAGGGTAGGNVNLGNNAVLTVGDATSTTYAGIISGTGTAGLTKQGAGTLTLTGANSYTGLTTVGVGVLNIRNSLALGTAAGGTSVTSGAALQIQNNIGVGAEALTLNGTGIANDGALRNISGTNTYGGLLTLGSAARINSDAGTLTLSNTGTITGETFGLTVGGAGNTTINSSIGTTSGTLTKEGSGTLTLAGANTYTGTTTVSAGVLTALNTAALPNYQTQAISVGPNNAVLAVRVGAGSPGEWSDTEIGNLLNNSNLTFASPSSLGIDTTFNNYSISTVIPNKANMGLAKRGANILTLYGANAYSGNTTITQGTLRAGAAGAIPGGAGKGNVVFDVAGNTAVLDIYGNDTTINGLWQTAASSTNRVVNDAVGTAKTLTVGDTNAISTFAGVIANNTGTGGTLALTKTGLGTQTLANTTANSYTGATTVNAGTLRLLGGTAMGGTSASITVNTGATLLLDNNSANVGVNNPAINLNNATLSYLSGNNTYLVLNAVGGPPTTNGVTNTGSSVITVQAGGFGTAGFYLDGGLKGTGTVTVNNSTGGVGLNLRNNNTTFSGTLIVNGTASTTPWVASGIGVGGGTTGLQNVDITLNGTMELQNRGIGVNNTRSATQTFLMGALNGTGVMVGNSNTANDTATVSIGNTNNNGSFSGVIADGWNNTTSITKIGSGTQTLSGANTYRGNTTITLGTLQVGADGAIPNVSGKGNVVFSTAANTAILDINGINTTINGLSQAAASTTNQVVNNAVSTSRTLTVGNNNATTTFAGIVANNTGTGGTLALTKIGAGILTLQGANTYTGGTVVNGGTLLDAAAANLPSAGDLTIGAAGNFSMVNSAAVVTYAANSLILAGGANLSFDLVGTNGVDVITSTNAATTSGGNIGISITGSAVPVVNAATTLISSASGGLTTSGTNYFVANNTNYTATLNQSPTAVEIASYTSGVAALTNAYWLGDKVTGALGAMALSSGATSNWASAAAGTPANGVVPGGSTVNAIFGATGAAQQANVTTGANMNLGSITFNDNNVTAVTIGGSNYITLNSTQTAIAATTGPLAAITNTPSAISVTQYATSPTINANLVLGAGQTWNVAAAKTLTVNGVVGGTNSLTLGTSGNTGTVVLAGANTYTGATAINYGTVQAGGVSVAGVSGPLGNDSAVTTGNNAGATLDLNGYDLRIGSLAGGGSTGGGVSLGAKTLTVGGNNTNTQYSGVISSSAGVTGVSLYKTGTGNLQLSRENTFTGKIVIDGGMLIAGNDNSSNNEAKLGTSPTTFQADNITIRNGSHLVLYTGTDGYGISANRGIYLDTGAQFIDSGGGDFFMNSVISGPGSLFHSNQGSWGWNGRRLYLTAANTFTGDTWWDASGTASDYGGIQMQGNPLALQNSAISADSIASWLGVSADVNGVLQIGGLVGTGRTSQNLFGSPNLNGLILNPTVPGVTKTYTNVIGQGSNVMSLTKTGAGTQALNGLNTYTGATSIKAGVLSINTIRNVGGGASSLGAPTTVPNGTIAIGDTATGATLVYTGLGDTTDRIINLAGTTGGATLDQSGAAGVLTLNGNVTATVAGAKTLTLQGSTAGSGVIGGIISDSSLGATSLTKTGTGTWTLNAANTYTGNTTLSGGTLILGNNLALQNSALNYTGSTLAFSGGINTPTFGGLTGSTSLSLASNVTALTLSPGTGVTHTYSGSLNSSTQAMTTLTKAGSGTQVLSGANAYTGETKIDVGKLYLNGTNATSAISVADGATLGGNGSAASATATVATGTTTGGIVEAGYGGAGTLTLNGLTFSGNGTVKVAGISNYGTNPAVDVLNSGGLTASGGAGSVKITLSGSMTPGTGTLHMIRYAGLIGDTGFSAFGIDRTGLAISPADVLTLADNTGYVDLDYDVDYPVWTGVGTGNWITEANRVPPPPGTPNWVRATNAAVTMNYTAGDTPLFDDSVGAGPTTVDISAADVAPSAVTFNNTTAYTYTLQSTGGYGITSGLLTKSNTGRVIVTTDNSYSGGTTINKGTIQVGNATTTGTLGSGAITDGTGIDVAVLEFNRTNTLTMAMAISGTGSVVQNGSGTLELNGDNSYQGGTTLNAGSLVLGSTTALGTGPLTINGCELDSSVTDLVLTSDNAQVWNSDFTFTGSQNLNLGIGAVSLGSTGSARTVTVGASTLTVGGIISDGTATALTKDGTGAMVLGGANDYSGGTTVNAGTVTVNDGAALGTGPLAVNNPNAGVGTDVVLNLNGNVGTGSLSGTIAPPTGGTNTATINIANGKSFTVTQTADDAYAGTIGGGGKLVKEGGSKLTLSGANTYTGGTKVSDGTLIVSSLSNLGPSGTIAFTGGTFQYTGSDVVSTDRFLHTGGTQTYDITESSASLTLTQRYAGSTIIKKGAGTFELAGLVNWDHENQGGLYLSVDEGTVLLNSDPHAPAFMDTLNAVNDVKTGATLRLVNANGWQVMNWGTFHMSGGTFDLNGNTNNMEPQIDGTSGTITNSNAAPATLTVYPNLTNTFGGDIVDGTGVVGVQYTQSWLGTHPNAVWTLSGNNTYTGATLVGLATLKAGAPSAFSPNSVFTIGSAGQSATLDLAGFDSTLLGLTTGGTAANQTVKNSTGIATLTVNNDVSNGDTDYTFGGVLRNGTTEEGSGVLNLTKEGSKTLTLSGPNTYTGDTTVNAGTLAISGSGTLGTGSTLTMGGGALDLGTTSQTVGAVSITTVAAGGVDTIKNGSLTGISYAASNSTGNAVISANLLASGSAGLTMSGAGTLTISGTNTYTGTTAVDAGTLLVNGDNSAATGAVTVASGATLGGTGIIGGPVTLDGTVSPGASAGTLTINNNMTWNNGGKYVWETTSTTGTAGTEWDLLKITGTGALNFSNVGGEVFTMELVALGGALPGWGDGSNEVTWTVAQAAGGINDFNAGKFTIDLAGWSPNLVTGNFQMQQNVNDLELKYAPVNEYEWKADAATDEWHGGANWSGGWVPTLGKTAVFPDYTVLPANMPTLSDDDRVVRGLKFLRDGWTLFKSDDRTLTVRDLGIESTGGASTSNTIEPRIAFADSATITVTGATHTLNTAALDATGFTLTKAGNGTLDTGSADVTADILNLDEGILNTAGVAGNAFNVNGGSATVGADSVSLGALTMGGGSLDLGGTVTGTVGAVSITAAAASSDTIYNGSLTATSYAASNSTGDAVVSAILLDGSVTKSGAGQLTLSGANTYTGATSIDGGILQANHATALGDGGDITFGGGTLQYTTNSAGEDWAARILNSTAAIKLDTNSQSVTFTDAIDSTNTGGLTKAGAGTLTLLNANTYTGATTISAGTLALGASGTIDNSTTIIVGDAGSSGTVLDLTAKTSFSILSGQTLKGIGTVNIGAGNTVTVDSGGVWAPGNSIGTIAVTGDLTLSGNADFELGTPGENHGSPGTSDRATVTGTLTLGGTLNLIDQGAGAGSYRIFTQTGSAIPSFATINNITGFHAVVDTGTSGSVYLDNYQVAVDDTITTPVNLTNVHVGGTFGTSALTITNLASSVLSEGLNADKGTPTGDASVSGDNILNLAGGESSIDISVGLDAADTDTAGAKTGTVPIDLASNGTNSGYSDTSLGTQTITVNGGVYNLAVADTITTPVNLGSMHVSDPGTSALTITNTAPSGAYTEGLDATKGTPTGDASVSGTDISNLPGGESSIDILVGVNTGTAGAKSGTVPIDLASNGTNSSLSDTSLGTQTITVNGDVFALAATSSLPTTVDLTNVHVGGTFGTQAVPISNTGTGGALYTEGLDAAAGTPTGQASSNDGSFADLRVGAGSDSSIVVGLSGSTYTGTAGAKSGTVPVALTSNGTISGLSPSDLGTQDITVNGDVFALAATSSLPTTVNLTRVHVGGTFGTQAVAISNTGTGGASYTEGLDAAAGTPTGQASSNDGSFSDLRVGAGSNSSIVVGLSGSTYTGTAGLKTGTVPVTLTSNGTISGLSPSDLGTQDITVNGSVYSGQSIWTGASGGSWGTLSSGFGVNWGADQGSPGLDSGFTGVDTATFGNTSGSVTVNLNGASPNLNAVTFNGTGGYTIALGSGGAITLAGTGTTPSITATGTLNTIQANVTFANSASITVASATDTLVLGATTIAAGGTLTKTGLGTLTFGGAQNPGAGAVLQVGSSAGGVVNLNTNAGTLSPGSGTPTVANLLLRITGGTGGGDSKVVLGSDQVLAGLDVQKATGGLQELDLNDKAVRVFPANVGTLEQAIRTMISATRISGDGIYDSTAAVTERVGYTDRRWDANGQQYVAIRAVYGGDANMDGKVDIGDAGILGGNYGKAGVFTWDQGDLNYDGVVNIGDAGILGGNYGKTGGNHVPEPATLGLMALGLAAMAARRRRSR